MQVDAHVVRAAGGPFVLERVDLDEPRSDEVLVRIVATGICHTDLAIANQYFPLPLPWVLGHEGAGIVERVGGAVPDLEIGDHVVLSFTSCGECHSCLQGRPAYCDKWFDLNISGRREDGTDTIRDAQGAPVSACFFHQSSFAQFAIAQRRNVVRVRKDAPLEMLGPLGCGIQTGAGAVLNVLKPAPGASMAVFGAGAVGLAAIMAAKIAGCSRIIAVDKVDSRLALASDVGATMTLQGSNAAEQIIADGGVDFSIEATGLPAVAEAAISVLNRSGVCGVLGTPPRGGTLSIDWPFLSLGRTVRGIVEGDADPQVFIPQLVDYFLEGRLPLDKIVRFYSMRDFNEAVNDCHRGDAIKPVVRYSE